MTASTRKTPGRPPLCKRELAEDIVAMRLAKWTYGQICIALNARDIPTPGGSPEWKKNHVARLLRTGYAQEIKAQAEAAARTANPAAGTSPEHPSSQKKRR